MRIGTQGAARGVDPDAAEGRLHGRASGSGLNRRSWQPCRVPNPNVTRKREDRRGELAAALSLRQMERLLGKVSSAAVPLPSTERQDQSQPQPVAELLHR